MQPKRIAEIGGWIAVAYLLYIGLEAIFTRAMFMNAVRGIPPADAEAALDPFNIRYYRQPLAVALHLLPGLLVFTLGPLQFIRKLRSRWLTAHRWSGRIFILAGMVGAVSGFVLGTLNPFGGVAFGFNEAMATAYFSVYVVACLTMALVRIKQRRIAVHREWMIRSFAALLAVATERVMLRAIQGRAEIPFEELFGTTFWMAIIVNIVVAELWIQWTRPRGRRVDATAAAAHWKDTAETTGC